MGRYENSRHYYHFDTVHTNKTTGSQDKEEDNKNGYSLRLL